MIIPREAFRGLLPDDAHGLTAVGARHALLHDYFRWLFEAPAPSPRTDLAGVARAVAAVVIACLGRGTRPPEEAAPSLRIVALQRLVADIDARLAEPALDPAALARRAGVSRATLYRLAEPHGGVDALIWERRLEAVRRALADPARAGRLADIAGAYGFKTAAHFSHRFKARYGFSPRNLRPF